MLKEKIDSIFNSVGFTLNTEKSENFITYLSELKKWNEKQNLTAILDEIKIVKKLFVSSLNFSKLIEKTDNVKILDLGSGAGFPGLPIKIFLPNINMTLIDGSPKKVKFLNHITKLLKLSEINCVAKRIEEWSLKCNEGKESYDYVVTMGVTNIKKLIKLSFPVLKKDGLLIIRKGENIFSELEDAKKSKKKYEIKDIVEIEGVEEMKYWLVSIRKI